MSTKPRLVVLGAATGALLVLVTTGVLLRTTIVEEYYLWRLRADEEDAVWAAEQLAAIGSVRAVPDLIAAFEKEATSAVESRISEREVLFGDPNRYLGEREVGF